MENSHTLDYMLHRIESKRMDFHLYNFSEEESSALRIFFELAQEFDSIEDFYLLCVAIPKAIFRLDSRLYLIDPKTNEFTLVKTTEADTTALHTCPPAEVKPHKHPYCTISNSLVLSIRGKEFLMEQLPFRTEDLILGLLEIFPVSQLSNHDELFFEKYANRIGFNLHNRFLADKNVEHLRFIRTLVADIEHNIIVPNMIYKLFLRRLKGKIVKNKEIELVLREYATGELCDRECLDRLQEEMVNVNQGLLEEFENLEKHYQNMSLFLETLFRRSHFDLGRLTLRTKRCNMKKDVVYPQLERFSEQFWDAGIEIDDRLSGIPDEEIIDVVDVGLIAQVYANLFSNALKYTKEVILDNGQKRKYLSYGHEAIRDFFGQGKDGVKYNVFTTGPHIKPEDRQKIFEDEYRGANALDRPGTGHGLTFVKNVVEIHGGVVGYEPTRFGNNFYFILPR